MHRSSRIASIDVLPETLPGTPRQTLDFPHLSGSQLNQLSACGLAYYFNRVEELPSPSSSRIIKGSAFHEGMTGFLHGLRNGMPLTDCVEAAREFAEQYILLNVPDQEQYNAIEFGARWFKGPLDTRTSMLADVDAAIRFVCAQPFVQTLQPLSIERGYVIHWADGETLPLVGYIDVAHRRGEKADVLDWKTGGKLKGLFALPMDLAQIGYAFGAEHDLQCEVDSISYGNLVWDAPANGSNEISIHFATPKIPFDPLRIERLYQRCASASRELRDGRFRMGDSDFICPTCPFRYPCSERFGQLPASVLDSASFVVESEVQPVPVVSLDTGAPPPVLTGGMTEKQYLWIAQLLTQAQLTLADALLAIGISGRGALEALRKTDASALIDYLKPLADRAATSAVRERYVNAQIRQARLMLQHLDPPAALAVLHTCGLETAEAIDSPALAHRVLATIAARTSGLAESA